MARFNKGILGGFSGKIGSVVGVTQGDIFHMRSVPRVRNIYTPNEIVNQAKFEKVQNYLKPLKELVRVGFKNHYTKTGGYRGAISYTRKVALVSDDAGIYIDPALFKFSGGELPGAIEPTVRLDNGSEFLFTWNYSRLQGSDGSDQMMVLIYDPVNLKALTRIFDGAFRSAGELSIPIPPELKGKDVDVYIGFVAADRTSQSESQYLGRLAISE